MRSIEDKSCYNHQEISSSNSIGFEFQKSNNVATTRSSHHRIALGKPTPSKWDDAQKWLVGLSRGGGSGGDRNQTKPRNSNADDRRLIAPALQKEQDYSSEEDEAQEVAGNGFQVETKKVDCEDSVWRINKPLQNSSSSVVRSICVRDMGTEMTPIASQEPSRTGTPIRARTPTARSPISSGSSTPVRGGLRGSDGYQTGLASNEGRGETGGPRQYGEEANMAENKDLDQVGKMNPLETRAMAWDEAERAKYMARYKREEVKIQAWENHEKRKAEMEMRKMEVKAERMKARAQEKFANKLAAAKRIAEEKRANAEAKLNEKAVKTSERADYIRRSGHLPSYCALKLPSFCWWQYCSDT